MSNAQIEQRLTIIEADLAALKTQTSEKTRSHPADTLEKIHGRFANDQAFKQAPKLGRQWRNSDRLAAVKIKGKA